MQHCSDEDSTTRPLLLVTASVDKMVLMKPIRVDTDLKIAGAVTYVGHSSIDIQIEVTQVDQDSVGKEIIYPIMYSIVNCYHIQYDRSFSCLV